MRGLALPLLLLATEVQAQVVGDRNTLECAVLVEQGVVDSSIEVICGIPSADMIEMMQLAVSGRDDDYSALLERLDAMTPEGAQLRAASIRSFFRVLEQDEVPADQLNDRLAEIASRHLRLQAELQAFQIADPDIQAELDAASAALGLDPPDHGVARQALVDARALRRAKREAAQALFEEQSREEARIARSQAELELSVLNRLAAAQLFEEAEGLLPEADVTQRWSDLFSAADAAYEHGRLRGDNAALERSIGISSRMLYLKGRAEHPDEWANTQNNLGNALATLGERERGTERLEEAVTAYRSALEERTRDLDPLNWAATQNNLGNALRVVGERQPGTVRLEEAVAAYRSALEENTRDKVPLQWAGTQNNIGVGLAALAAREAGTARLEEAIAAYRSALEEWTRDKVPLEWALTQNNLGNALLVLGRREPGAARLEEAVTAFRCTLEEWTRDRIPPEAIGMQNILETVLAALRARETSTARLEEAVAAYRSALEENTRDKVPLQWALTQNNLGNALAALGEREPCEARLEEAVAAYRSALEEYDRERVPLDWAGTQHNLGNALKTLGQREPGTKQLEEAAAVYRNVLKEYERDRVPLQWAGTTYILSYTTALIAERTGDATSLPKALSEAQSARAVLLKGGHAHWANMAEQVIDAIEQIERDIKN